MGGGGINRLGRIGSNYYDVVQDSFYDGNVVSAEQIIHRTGLELDYKLPIIDIATFLFEG